MKGMRPLLRKTHSYTEFCNYFRKLFNLLQLTGGLHVKNSQLIEMGDNPKSKSRKTCSVEENGERLKGCL